MDIWESLSCKVLSTPTEIFRVCVILQEVGKPWEDIEGRESERQVGYKYKEARSWLSPTSKFAFNSRVRGTITINVEL